VNPRKKKKMSTEIIAQGAVSRRPELEKKIRIMVGELILSKRRV